MQRSQSARREHRSGRGALSCLRICVLAAPLFALVLPVGAQESRANREGQGSGGERAPGSPVPAEQTGKQQTKPGRSMAEIDRAWMDAIRSNARDGRSPKSSGSGAVSEVGEGRARTGGGEGEVNADGRTGVAGGEKRERLSDPGPRGTPPPSRMFSGGGDDASFLSVVFRFVAILAVMLGGFYLFVRYTRGRNGMGAQTSDLVQVIASVPLIQGRFLQIVDMGGRLLVLGVSDHAVSLLSEVTDARTVDRIRVWQSQNRPGPEQSGGLLGRLTRLIRGTEFRFWNAAAEGARPNTERDSFRHLLREQGGSAAAAAAWADTHPPTVEAADTRTSDSGPPMAEAPASRTTTAPDSAGRMSSVRSSSPGLFDFAAPSPEPEGESAPDEAELAALLKAQRRRIRALQSKQES